MVQYREREMVFRGVGALESSESLLARLIITDVVLFWARKGAQ